MVKPCTLSLSIAVRNKPPRAPLGVSAEFIQQKADVFVGFYLLTTYLLA